MKEQHDDDSDLFDLLRKQGGIKSGWHLGPMTTPNPAVADAAKREIASNQRKLDAKKRLERIDSLTQPNMVGFFPKFDSSAAHSNFSLSQFDTETADDNRQIVEIAGVQVIWNKSKQRFEQLPNASLSNQFYRFYNPSNASYLATEVVHGYNPSILDKIRQKFGMSKSLPLSWNQSQLADFKQWAKGTIFTGHNIYNADLAWIHNRKSGEFIYELPGFKQGFLDTFHLAEAVYGKSPKGEGRNKLQNLANKLGVSASSLGLPAHEAWADSIVNLKVLEKIIQQNPDNPAVLEFINAMDYGNMQSHRKENPDPLHGSYLVTHTINEKPVGQTSFAKALKKKFKIKIKEKYINDIPSSLGMTEEAFIEGSWDKGSYEEMSMDSTEESLKEELEYLNKHIGGGLSGTQYQDLLKTLAANTGWAKISYRERMLAQISNKGLSESEKRYALKDSGFVPREINAILRRSSDLEEASSRKASEAEYKGLRLRTGRFLAEQAAAGYSRAEWFETLRDAHKQGTLTEDILATAKQSRKNQDAREAAWEKEKALKAEEEAQRNDWAIKAQAAALNRQPEIDYKDIRNAYTRLGKDKQKYGAYLFKSDIPELEEAAAGGTEKYAEALEKIIDRNSKVIKSTEQLAKIPIYDPMQILNNMSTQYSHIRHAAHGILPGFMERPIFRFTDALKNQYEMQRARAEGTTNVIKNVVPAIASAVAGVAGTVVGTPVVGAAAGATAYNLTKGGIGLLSQITGNYANTRVTEMSEGIQHRLNLLGMATSTLGAFISGLRIAIGLFSKLGSLWSYMPSYTNSTLNGVQWQQAQPLMATDRLLGFREGTLHNMYNNLAYQQGDLYTSGKYNEDTLVAAARLGIFNLAYAPMGGNAQEQQRQIVNKLYGDVYAGNLTEAERQSKLSLIHQYDSNMVSILERMHGMGITDYAALTSNRGWKMLSTGQNATVSYASWDWDLAQRSTREGLSLAGSRAYDIAKPLIQSFNDAIWAFAEGRDIDWQGIADKLGEFWEKLVASLGGFKQTDWSKFKDSFAPVLDTIFESLKTEIYPRFRDFMTGFVEELANINVKFDWLGLLKEIAFNPGKDIDFSKYINATSSASMAKEVAKSLDTTYEQKADYVKQVKDSIYYRTDPAYNTDIAVPGMENETKWKARVQAMGFTSLSKEQAYVLQEALDARTYRDVLKSHNIDSLEGFNQQFRIMSKGNMVQSLRDKFGDEVVDDILASAMQESLVGKALDSSGEAIFSTYQSLLDAVRQGLKEAGLSIEVMNASPNDIAVKKLQNQR